MDAADGGAVIGRVGGVVALHESSDNWLEGRLQEQFSGSGPRFLGDQGERRVSWPKRAIQKLGGQHT